MIACNNSNIQQRLNPQKNFWGPNLGQNQAQNQVFCHFFKFGSLVFLEIAQDDSLEQCLNTSRDKTRRNIWGPKFGPNRPKSGPKLCFMLFSQVWFISFPENCRNDSLEHCLTTSRGKTHKKSFGAPSWDRNQGFCYFLKFASLVFLDIAQDYSLGQCLISNRAATSSQIFFVAEVGAEMIFSILMLSSVHSNLFVL